MIKHKYSYKYMNNYEHMNSYSAWICWPKKISAARAFRQSETTSSMSNAQQSQQHTSEFFGCATFTILTHKIYNMGDKLWLHE